MVAIEILITVFVLMAAVVLFVTEWVPVSITALGAAAVLMITGVVNLKEGLSGFSNEATITVLGMLVIAAAVNRSGLILSLAHKTLDVAAGSSGRFLLLLMVFAAVTSAFLANTPIVAMLIPLVITVAGRLGDSPSKFLMPMAFATTLGGMLTLVGTSTNVLASSISERMGFGAFSFFEFTRLGVIVSIVGITYLAVIGYRLLPARHKADELETHYDFRDFLCEIVIRPNSALIGQTVEKSSLKIRYNIDFIRIVRGDKTIDQPLVGTVLQAGDVLLVRAPRDEILKIREDQGVDLLQEITQWMPTKGTEQRMVEIIIPPGSILDGTTLASVQFRGRYDAVVLAVKKRDRTFLKRLSKVRLNAGDGLLVAGTPQAITQLRTNMNFIVTHEMEPEEYRRDKIPFVLATLAGVILLSALEILPIPVAALAGVVVLVVTGCLHIDEMQQAIPWHLVFLLAGLIPLGIALEKSGTAALAAEYLYILVQNWHPAAILAVIYMVTLLLTEIMSNNASVAIMIPLGVELAQALSLDPIPFIFAATFGASLAFMAPIGYQTYLMVYGPGEYKFADFLKVGAPLNLLCMITTVILLNIFWPV